MGTVVGIAFLALLLTFGIAWFVAGQILKPIRSLRQVAEAISDKNFTGRVPVVGKDDIAAMSLTFNQMLDRLENSATTQRRFLDDVSHELRTPITIVRGHLELMERSTQEQSATLDLVDDELDRMGRIVADLLLLAKSERPDFIHITPADPAALMISLESKVQAFHGHRWLIAEIADGEADLDEQRITQALLQLCANAAQYSPEGASIELGSRFSEQSGQKILSFWVRDHGPGVDPADAHILFDRFQRNNAKNPATAQQHSSGAGLGLAIVKTIAEGHRGQAWVATPDSGTGTVFGLTIPAHTRTPERKEVNP